MPRKNYNNNEITAWNVEQAPACSVPHDVWRHIFSLFNHNERNNAALVCKLFYKITCYVEKSQFTELGEEVTPTITAFVVADSNHLFVAYSNKTMKVWAITDTPACIRIINLCTVITVLAQGKDGLIVGGGANGALYMWAQDGTPCYCIKVSMHPIRMLAVGPENCMAALSREGLHIAGTDPNRQITYSGRYEGEIVSLYWFALPVFEGVIQYGIACAKPNHTQTHEFAPGLREHASGSTTYDQSYGGRNGRTPLPRKAVLNYQHQQAIVVHDEAISLAVCFNGLINGGNLSNPVCMHHFKNGQPKKINGVFIHSNDILMISYKNDPALYFWHINYRLPIIIVSREQISTQAFLLASIDIGKSAGPQELMLLNNKTLVVKYNNDTLKLWKIPVPLLKVIEDIRNDTAITRELRSLGA